MIRFDTFQTKGPRHILKIEHSYWSHKSNKELIEKVDYGGYVPGTKVSHVKFGLGKIKDCKPKGENYKLDIDFEGGQTETLLSTFIKIVSEEVKK